MNCPKCGRPIKKDANFCGNCGTKIETKSKQSTETGSILNGKNLISGLPKKYMIAGICAVIFLVLLFGHGGNKKSTKDESVRTEDENIENSEKAGVSDLTGTYENEDGTCQLLLVEETDGNVSYRIISDEQPDGFTERQCYIDGSFIYGDIGTISNNIDKSLNYSGDFSVDNLKKVSDQAEISADLTFDLYTDAMNGLLFLSENGEVVDMDGEMIPEYNYITAAREENCLLIYGEFSTDYTVNFYGRILYSPGIYESEEAALIDALGASWEDCSTEYGPRLDWNGSDPAPTEIIGDGDYFDEIVLNAWYDENGDPIADYIPQDLSSKFSIVGRVPMKQFHFVDNVHYTIEQIKRLGSVSILPDVYVFLFPDIQKDTSWTGEQIIRGHDYFTGEEVVVHSIPKGVLNGDNLLVFSIFNSTADDDTLNVDAIYSLNNYF